MKIFILPVRSERLDGLEKCFPLLISRSDTRTLFSEPSLESIHGHGSGIVIEVFAFFQDRGPISITTDEKVEFLYAHLYEWFLYDSTQLNVIYAALCLKSFVLDNHAHGILVISVDKLNIVVGSLVSFFVIQYTIELARHSISIVPFSFYAFSRCAAPRKIFWASRENSDAGEINALVFSGVQDLKRLISICKYANSGEEMRYFIKYGFDEWKNISYKESP